MADPGDTAALCNDTKSHIAYEAGQPTDPDIEAGSVIGEEPTTIQGEELGEDGEEIPEGEEEGTERTEPDATSSEKRKSESKVPFVYMIIEPGCTPLSCYSAIITFFIMTCGVFWLLLISPPLNAKAYDTRLPWLDNSEKNGTLDGSLHGLADDGASSPSLLELEVESEGSAVALSSSTPVMPVDPDPALLQTNQT